MRRNSYRARRPVQPVETEQVSRPTASTLLLHIVRALLVDGLGWLVITVALAVYLDIISFHQDWLVVLALTGLAGLALVRGCIAWQQDLVEYQHELAVLRHQEQVSVQTDPTFRFPASRHN